MISKRSKIVYTIKILVPVILLRIIFIKIDFEKRTGRDLYRAVQSV